MLKKIFFFIFLIFNFFITASALGQKNIIYIYSDEGAGSESLKHTLSSMHEMIPSSYHIQLIKAKEVLEGKWHENAVLFIMPGGADLPYAAKLNGKGNGLIRSFISNGGAYLGICAGGYYGSSHVEFDKNGPLEVIGSRELAFFPGKAIGPILAPYDYKTNSGARAANISFDWPNYQTSLYLYYNGGGYFAIPQNTTNLSIIGWYNLKEQKLPAILKINYGRGRVILSGVHFEYNPNIMVSDSYSSNIIPLLKKDNEQREKLLQAILKYLLNGEI